MKFSYHLVHFLILKLLIVLHNFTTKTAEGTKTIQKKQDQNKNAKIVKKL